MSKREEGREQEMKNRLFPTCYLVISSQIRKAKMAFQEIRTCPDGTQSKVGLGEQQCSQKVEGKLGG